MDDHRSHIIAVLACHNRRPRTLTAIQSARDSAATANLQISFVVYDDGSSDGTAESLCLASDVAVIRGSGSAYWALGMAVAEAQTIVDHANDPPEALLWLNDDVTLDKNALRIMWHNFYATTSLIVGPMRDSRGLVTYSGLTRAGRHPLTFRRVDPDGETAQAVDTFNGNAVLVPWRAVIEIGGIDGGFPHGLADFDYGLRAKAQGWVPRITPVTVGVCERNALTTREGTVVQRWRGYRSVKGGGHYGGNRRFLQRYCGSRWWFYLYGSYVMWGLRELVSVLRGSGRD